MLRSTIDEIINPLTKKQLLDLGNEVFLCSIPDYEGHDWKKQDGRNLIAYEVEKNEHDQEVMAHFYQFVDGLRHLHEIPVSQSQGTLVF